MPPPARSVIRITPGKQPCSRKCRKKLEGCSGGGGGDVQHQLLGWRRAEQLRPPALNSLVFPGAENGTLLWTPKLLEPLTLEILARSAKDNLSSVLKPRTVVCACEAESQCLYNQTSWVGDSSLEVSGEEGWRWGGRGSKLRERKWELKGCRPSAPLC